MFFNQENTYQPLDKLHDDIYLYLYYFAGFNITPYLDLRYQGSGLSNLFREYVLESKLLERKVPVCWLLDLFGDLFW